MKIKVWWESALVLGNVLEISITVTGKREKTSAEEKTEEALGFFFGRVGSTIKHAFGDRTEKHKKCLEERTKDRVLSRISKEELGRAVHRKKIDEKVAELLTFTGFNKVAPDKRTNKAEAFCTGSAICSYVRNHSH